MSRTGRCCSRRGRTRSPRRIGFPCISGSTAARRIPGAEGRHPDTGSGGRNRISIARRRRTRGLISRRRLAVEAFRAIDGAGMARADFLLDQDGGALYVNELNTIPGFTRISMYPKLWDASGLTYPALMDRLIELAMARQAQKDRLVRRYGDDA